MKKVLVVDDSAALGQTMVMSLKVAKVDARWSGSGAEAVDMTKKWGPDVVLMDRNLGDEDGLKVSKQLEGPKGRKPLVYLVSGDPPPRKLPVGIKGYLQKPVDRKTLLELIGN